MPKNVKPLIGTANAFSVAAGTSDINGASIENDFPPEEQFVSSAFIHPDGTGTEGITITVKFQLYSGADWGIKHTCVDANGSNITFDAASSSSVEVNLYAQPEFKLADKWRIVLSRDGSTLLAGNATAVIK